LGNVSHGISFIENDQLESRAKELFCATERLDLVTDDINPPIIRGIEFQDHRRQILAIELPGASQNGGGLSSPRRTIKQQMGQPILIHEANNGRYNFLVRYELR
jgi:hypothetical protein